MGIRLGAIGLGTLGRMQLEGIADDPSVEIVAAADVDTAARNRFESRYEGRAYEDYEVMLASAALDAVTIVTPHTLHYEQAMACVNRGLDVLLEKPMVTDTADAVDLVQRADANDVVVQVGYQRHLHPGYQAVRETIRSGQIGRVHMASCSLAQDWIGSQVGTWRSDPALSGGGQLIDSGSHLLDVLLWTTDATASEVAAVMDDRDHDVDVNSALAATLDAPDGPITASIGISADGTDFEERVTIWGTDGYLTYEGSDLSIHDDDGDSETRAFDGGGYQEQTTRKVEAFLETVRGDRANPCPGEFGLRVTALTDAAYRARTAGETIDVDVLVDEARDEVADRRR